MSVVVTGCHPKHRKLPTANYQFGPRTARYTLQTETLRQKFHLISVNYAHLQIFFLRQELKFPSRDPPNRTTEPAALGGLAPLSSCSHLLAPITTKKLNLPSRKDQRDSRGTR